MALSKLRSGLLLLLGLLAIFFSPHGTCLATTPADGFVTPYAGGTETYVARAFTVDSKEVVGALRWYNNDGSIPISAVLLVESVDGRPAMDQVLYSQTDVYGASDSWTQLDLSSPVSPTSSQVFAVFRLPAAHRSSVGVGGGPGIGYMNAPVGEAPCLISADGVEWVALGPSVALGAEITWTDAGLARASAAPGGAPGAVLTGEEPIRTQFSMVYPNPASTHTRFAFDLARREHVSVQIYNARGQLIKDLVDHWLPAGHHQVQWLGSDANGSRVSHGVYFAVFRAGDITATREVSLLP